MSVNIHYKNNLLTEIGDGGTKILKTRGKYMEDDLSISDTTPEGIAGIPTATKGTVSNNSITVTPSVTNTAGYISGGTQTGTAVTVTASELASGNKSITDNGTGIDVVGYSTVSVNVVDTYTLEYQWDSEEGWPVFDDTYANIKAAVLANKTFKYTSFGDDVIGAWYASCYATNYNSGDRTYTECVRFYLEGEGKIWRVFYGYSGGSLEIECKVVYLIPSGNKSITQNGTGIDVASYSTVSVSVAGGNYTNGDNLAYGGN